MQRSLSKVLLGLSILFIAGPSWAKEKVYDLTVRSQDVTKAGFTLREGLTINDQVPAPTLEFELGDTAVINVKNETNEVTSLHWHGVLVPWDMDGPMFSNNKPIEPGTTFTFRFPIKHSGTYWYHSHTMLQEQRGLYGAIVIKKPHEDHHSPYVLDRTLVLSDWTSENPKDILANLKKDGDYYGFKKGFLPSWYGAIRHGAVWDYIKSQWTRMGPMDLGDVAYDAFLINGEQESALHNHFNTGDKIRLRIINAGASSYFYVNIGNLRNFQVISKDGMEVEPVTVNELLMGMGETYDIVFTIPDDGMKSYEVRATAQDVTGFASFFLGHGTEEEVPDKIKPNPYRMDHGEHGGHGGDSGDDPNDGHDGDHGGGDHGGHDGHGVDHSLMNMNPDSTSVTGDHDGGDHGDHPDHPPGDDNPGDMPMSQRLNYNMLKAKHSTAFPAVLPRYHVTLNLDGDMERYTWYINGKPFSEEKYIEVNQGDVVQFTMVNKTMMHHPMHLHGHFFRLINGQGDLAPLAHTVDVGPMKTQTIEFYANEPGIWFFHCHNLYHMKMGMARLIKYKGFERPQDLVDSEKKHSPMMIHDNSPFVGGRVGLWTNHAETNVRINAGRYEVEMNLELEDYDPKTFEAEAYFKRFLTRYFAVMTGVEYTDEELSAIFGVQWTLPMQIEMTGYMNTRGQAVIKLKKEFPLTGRIYFIPEGQVRFERSFARADWEVSTKLMYRISKRWEIGPYYRFDGKERSHSIGFGLQWNF